MVRGTQTDPIGTTKKVDIQQNYFGIMTNVKRQHYRIKTREISSIGNLLRETQQWRLFISNQKYETSRVTGIFLRQRH